MKFLSDKFFDNSGLVNQFITSKNELLWLEGEKELINDNLKKAFRNSFITAVIEQGIIDSAAIDAVEDTNPWSIDFPGWFGSFNEDEGKTVFVIGSEPHIHHKYLQTVYGFNSKTKIDQLDLDTDKSKRIFKYLIALLKPYLKVTNNEDVLKECYLTDLIPFSPLKGEGTAVGSTAKIQSVINDKGVWVNIRREFAKISLQNEIEAVKPKLIIAQGKEVFEELIHVLMITEEPTLQAIIPINAKKRQYIRKIRWKNIDIVSVPHIGSKRMATFWKNNLEEVSRVFNEILK